MFLIIKRQEEDKQRQRSSLGGTVKLRMYPMEEGCFFLIVY